MKRFFILSLIAAALSGCITTNIEKEIKELDRVYLDDIGEMIHAGEIFKAYQDISFIKRNPDSDVSPEELNSLEQTIIEKTVLDFNDLIEKKDYTAAYRYFNSFKNINRMEMLPDWTDTRILSLLAEQSAEAGDMPAAFLYALKVLSREEPSEEQLNFILKMAIELGNSQIARDIIQVMQERLIPIPEYVDENDLEDPTVDKIVSGTVTIWINRGIKIERGVGYPDRVIGSGFFIDRRGYILTNYHVIASEVDPKYEGYSRLYIRLSDRVEEKIPARVIGYDRIFDLALIKAEVEPKFILSAGDKVDMKPGDKIIAIGSPAGLENTVTSGIVSATGRRFLQMGDAIQVDVPINYGNSGGPLLDSKGHLIGIVFAGIEQFEGINFAIPFYWVNKVLPYLYEEGEITHSWLGMALQETDDGLLVVYVVPGEPASRAGIQQGDIIKTMNGDEYKCIRNIQSAILDFCHPSLVSLEWKRGETDYNGFLCLAERPFSPIDVALERDIRDNILLPLFGMKIEKTGNYLWQTNYVIKQVLQGSIADETGLSENDPLRVQGWKVDSENRYAILQLFVKKKKSGFLESVIQLAAYLETDSFF